jgi:phosphatidylethanolamine/phosphatidyl-N-methylethanolamine N-methyltransferase
MNNAYNLKLYGFYAPRYERLFGWLYGRPQRRAVALLNVQPGERLFVPGVGTGMGLAQLPASAQITAIDLSPAMVAQAGRRLAGRTIHFEVMDAQQVRYPNGSFDAVLLSLILSVVPDGAAAFREAWRVLRPGGRAVIFDKFLPETGSAAAPLSWLRRAIGAIARIIGTDPNRRLSQLIAGAPGLVVERDEPSLLRGQYRIVLLRKQS